MDTQKSQIIIGLYSPAPQSGKSTFAEHLHKAYNFHRDSLAAPLKSMLDALFRKACYPENSNNVPNFGGILEISKRTNIPFFQGKTYRELCQSLGDWGRDEVSTDMWVDTLLERTFEYDAVVIDDVRFPNEAKAIRGRGGFLIKIIRDSATRPNDHHSEGGLENEKFDAVLTNNGSIEELFHQGVEALKNLNIPMHYNAH